MELNDDFVFKGLGRSGLLAAAAVAPSPLGPLAKLVGVWQGTGFNQIWRPFNQPPQDRFLELNVTSEKLQLEEIPGDIPNRGFLQPDISLRGITYLQQIQDTNMNAGIHVEPGIWALVPQTTNPAEPSTVFRLATIPHGTAFVAQGIATTNPGPPTIPDVSITPFVIGDPSQLIQFRESDLSQSTNFRSPLTGITQGMVDNPNSVLQAAIAGQNITETTILQISSKLGVVSAPDAGGGVDNIAFLAGNAPANANALAAEIEATFFIETVADPSGSTFLQLQYTQRVLLKFNTLSWPHVSVATLRKTT